MQNPIGIDIQKACEALKKGELIGIPTETVYGLAANALDEKAVLKIFKAKQRPAFDPLIVHVATLNDVDTFTYGIPKELMSLAESYMPGPLTLVLSRKNIIPDLVSSGGETVGIRIPAHPITLALLKSISFPLAAPSANPFGYISPTSAAHVAKQLGDQVAYILDGGNSAIGVESTVIDVSSKPIKVLRKGGLSIEAIAEKLGYWPQIQEHSSSNPKAPGMLASHYAPKKSIFILDKAELIEKRFQENEAALVFGEVEPKAEYIWQLSKMSKLDEAAANLFSFLRQLDENELIKAIYTHLLPEKELGRAINDRLRRAAISQ